MPSGRTAPPLRCSESGARTASGDEAAPGIRATVYRVNQDADQWHILLAWKHRGSLYTVSEHVIKPFDNATVVLKNLRRVLRGLVLVQPEG